jgi:hypothetical protein
MAEVVQFERRTRRNEDLVQALESALVEARAGRCRSGVIALMNEHGKERAVPVGTYKTDRGALSQLGFRLQAMAAIDSGFG